LKKVQRHGILLLKFYFKEGAFMQFEYTLRLLSDKSWQNPRLHFHDNYEVLFSLSNAGSIFVENEMFPLKNGTLCLFKNGELHKSFCNVDNFERYVLHFPESLVEQLADEPTNRYFPNAHCFTLMTDSISCDLKCLFDRLYALQNEEESSPFLKNIAFLELFYLLANIFSTNTQPGEPIDSPALNRIRPIMDYIQANISEPLSLDDLSQHFFLSKHYMCHLFKCATGFTVSEYIIRNRLARARNLLRNGYSVQSAGEMSGFQNNAHFIRTFGNIIGISPGRYAKEYKYSKKI